MKKTLSLCILLFAFCILLTACGKKCEHTYLSDCDETCDKCTEEREITAEHNYYGNCDIACHSCGKEREATAEHSWKPATCTALEACEGCGAVKGGDLLEHSYTVTGYDNHYHSQTCSMCKKTDEDSKEKHVLNDEYACACGVKYTVKQEGKIEIDAVVDLYNSEGMLIKEIQYEQGEIILYSEHYYNENGENIKSEDYDGDGELLYYFRYEFNENGDLLKESLYDSDGELLAYILCHYDENVFLVKTEYFDGDGALEEYIIYTNDENGNLLKEEDYSFDGTLEDTELYEYDENGNRIKRTHVNADGSTYSYQYEYDENRNLINETYTNIEGGITVSEYDETGNEIKTTHIYTDGYWSSSAYEYDENGNIVKEVFTDDDGQHQILEFDENGNNVRITHLWADGSKNIVDYDEKGLLIRDTSIDTDGNVYCVAEYEHILVGEDWRESKSTVTFEYGEMDTIVYEFNENGYCVKRTDTYTDGSGVIYEYEYDAEGNSINETRTEFGNTAQ